MASTKEVMTFSSDPRTVLDPQAMIAFIRRLEGFLQRLGQQNATLQEQVEALEQRIYALEHP